MGLAVVPSIKCSVVPLDPIYMSSYLQEYIKYPVDYTCNRGLELTHSCKQLYLCQESKEIFKRKFIQQIYNDKGSQGYPSLFANKATKKPRGP